MASRLAARQITAVMVSTLLLVACGGGGSDSDTNATHQSNANSEDNNDFGSPPLTSLPPPTSLPSKPGTESSNDAQATLEANNTFTLARTSCGLSGLSQSQELEDIASTHSNYIKHVYENTQPTAFSPHFENKIADIAQLTGDGNPFYRGNSLLERLSHARYVSSNEGVTENIAQHRYYTSAGNFVATDTVAVSMARSLLAAPYHLRSLMRPSSGTIGTGFISYNPYNKDPQTNRGYVLVTHSDTTPESKNNVPKGVFTYPCQGIQGTVTALYNENPNPVAGTNRDLRTDPIGQPIYINVPTAKTIKVSNIKFYDNQRHLTVPVSLLDYDNDPHSATGYKLPNNEAFILPLTDGLKSCEVGEKQGKNCGLYGNTEYRVSFDVLIDNKDLESKSFTFTTGKVNY